MGNVFGARPDGPSRWALRGSLRPTFSFRIKTSLTLHYFLYFLLRLLLHLNPPSCPFCSVCLTHQHSSLPRIRVDWSTSREGPVPAKEAETNKYLHRARLAHRGSVTYTTGLRLGFLIGIKDASSVTALLLLFSQAILIPSLSRQEGKE